MDMLLSLEACCCLNVIHCLRYVSQFSGNPSCCGEKDKTYGYLEVPSWNLACARSRMTTLTSNAKFGVVPW